MKSKNKITYLIVATTIATQVLPMGTIVSNAQQVIPKVATVRDGETKSISDNEIYVEGLTYTDAGDNNNLKPQKFNIKFDKETQTIKITNKTFKNTAIHYYYKDGVYFTFELYSKDGELKEQLILRGSDPVEVAENYLNGKHFEYGDYIKLSHIESSTRLQIHGDIINGTADLNKGISEEFLKDHCFKITDQGLKEIGIQHILPNEINLLGRKYQSGKQGFRVRFDLGLNKMIVDNIGVMHAKLNTKFKGKEYIKLELIRNGNVVDELTLNGDDKVDKALLLEDMTINVGDQIRVTHTEAKSQFKVTGPIGNATQENMQNGVNKNTVTFALTENGLTEVN